MSGPEVMEAIEAAPPEGCRDRIVGTGEADPKELLPNTNHPGERP